MGLYEKITTLAYQKKMSIRQLEEKLGYGNGTIRRWTKQNPGIDKIIQVSNFFDVSIDFLLDRTNEPNKHYHSDETMEAMFKIIDKDNEMYTNLVNLLPKLDNNELKIVYDMVSSLVALKQKKN